MTGKMFRGIIIVCLFANLFSVIVGDDIQLLSSKAKCPHLWKSYEDNCFMMYAVKATRQDAKVQCEDVEGGTLVSLLTGGDAAFVVDYWNQVSPHTTTIWLGLKRDPDNRDNFFWDNNVGIQYTNWISGEPNDATGREDCVVLSKYQHGWNDCDCYDMKYPFICMKPRV